MSAVDGRGRVGLRQHGRHVAASALRVTVNAGGRAVAALYGLGVEASVVGRMLVCVEERAGEVGPSRAGAVAALTLERAFGFARVAGLRGDRAVGVGRDPRARVAACLR